MPQRGSSAVTQCCTFGATMNREGCIATTLISVEEYLHTVYEPDAEYVDGVIEKRPMGEDKHSEWQMTLPATSGSGKWNGPYEYVLNCGRKQGTAVIAYRTSPYSMRSCVGADRNNAAIDRL